MSTKIDLIIDISKFRSNYLMFVGKNGIFARASRGEGILSGCVGLIDAGRTSERSAHTARTQARIYSNAGCRGILWRSTTQVQAYWGEASMRARWPGGPPFAEQTKRMGPDRTRRVHGFGSRRRTTKKDPESGLFFVAPTGIEPVCQD